MTETLCIGLAIVTAAFALVHLLLALWFRGWLKRQRAATAVGCATVDADERAAVLVAARGLDESVVETLRSLGRQDCSGYDVIVAADGWSERDADALSGLDRLHVIEGWERLSTCGLKCSALRAAVASLDSECRWVAFLDVDVAPGPGWLAALVGAAREPDGGGAASGLQWFEPVGGSPGAWVRSLWNAAALFPTALFANPWAGSMVLRREWLDESGLVDDWARNIVDDGPVRAALARLGKQHRLAPQVVMTNVEACSLAGAANWLGRMVKWNSIYEQNFVGTLLHALVTAAMLLGSVGLLIGGIWAGESAVWWLPASWALGNAFYLAGWLVMRDAARSSERVSVHQPAPSVGLGQLLAGLCLVTLTQILFCVAAFRSVVSKTYRWRGVEYDVGRDGSVRAMREVAAS